MDARSFGLYVRTAMLDKSKEYENALLTAAFDDVGMAKRTAGIRDTLVGIAGSIEGLLKDFYENGGNALPGETNSGVAPVNPVEDTPTIEG